MPTRNLLMLVLIGLCLPATMGASGQGLQHSADHWVCTDALGRSLPTHKEVGDRKPGKYVGIFYFVWQGHHTKKVYDITKILATGEPEKHWGPINSMHFWGEPEVGYFHASDPWVIRRDMQMLANAGIDFIYLDVTNAVVYASTVEQLLKTIKQMREQSIPAPKVVFTTNAASGKTINRIYDRFYKSGEHRGLWFEWNGKPLIFGQANDPVLRKEVKTHFTIKYSWAWTATKKNPHHWQWLDNTPQDYGWSKSPDKPEQIPVAVAAHSATSIGKSHHNRSHPPVKPDYTTDRTAEGLHFEEQWRRAHEVDPQVVMISGWNEWIAGRFIRKPGHPNYLPHFAGRAPFADGTTFVDAFSAEFNRDIAPMRGGYTDNYYYQMIGHVRRFKGMAAPPKRPPACNIVIDGKFDDWRGVPAKYLDPQGDTLHRKFRGTDPTTIYTNTTGRNDILAARVVEANGHVYFRVSTAKNIQPAKPADRKRTWMTLLIDTDQDKKTGWEGYDLAVNWKTISPTQARCARWSGGKWQPAEAVAYRAVGKDMELSVPDTVFPRRPGQGFDFKWVDNTALGSVESMFLEGDAAPDRRFNFRY